jgi:hypothetical protein
MAIVKQLTSPPRAISGGTAIEFDLGFEDDSAVTIQLPFTMIQMFQRAIWDAAAVAERRHKGKQPVKKC